MTSQRAKIAIHTHELAPPTQQTGGASTRGVTFPTTRTTR